MGDLPSTSALFSDCGRYRYELTRDLTGDGEWIGFVMLNPSTADALLDDPTIRRCRWFAEREGYGRLLVVNAYAYRATSPAAMLGAEDPIGPANDAALRSAIAHCSLLVAAWGANIQPERERAMRELLPEGTMCLGTTKGGHPKHPLYLRKETPLERWL